MELNKKTKNSEFVDINVKWVQIVQNTSIEAFVFLQKQCSKTSKQINATLTFATAAVQPRIYTVK